MGLNKIKNIKKYLKSLYGKDIKFSQIEPLVESPIDPVTPEDPIKPSPVDQPVKPTPVPTGVSPTQVKQLIPTKLNAWRKRGKGDILGYYFAAIGVEPESPTANLLEGIGYQYNAKFKTHSKKVDDNNYSQIREELSEIEEQTNVQFSEDGFEELNRVFNIDQIVGQNDKDKKVEEIVEDILDDKNIDNTKKKQITDKFIRDKIEELAEMTDESAKMELIQKFLSMGKDFHRYSFINYILMMLQNPNVSKQVAGKGQWESPHGKFKRKVKDGEKPMEIFAPAQKQIYLHNVNLLLQALINYQQAHRSDRYLFEVRSTESFSELLKALRLNKFPYTDYLYYVIFARGKSGIDGMISYISEDVNKPASKTYKSVYYSTQKNKFNMAQVYDIDQTEPTGPDSFEKPDISDVAWQAQNVDEEQANVLVEAILDFAKVVKWKEGNDWKTGISVDIEKDLGGEDLGGWSRGGEIAINKMSIGWRRFGTIVHEIAHSLLHFGPDRMGMTKKQVEIEAEATNFVVMNYFGYTAPEFCANYLALHKSTSQDVLDRYNKIDFAAKVIVQGIEKAMNKKGASSNWFRRLKIADILRNKPEFNF